MLGVYGYFDKKDNTVVYVGKDSHIEKNKRHNSHLRPSHCNAQPFNRILQNNPNRYVYQVLVWNIKDQNTLNAVEMQYIRQLKPRFNFTDGGEGINGFKFSKEARKKMSQNNGRYWKDKNLSNDTRKKMSKAKKGKKHSEETKNKMSQSHKGKQKGKDNPLWKDYARIIKGGLTHNGKQLYALRYDGKIIKQSIYKNKLEEIVKELNVNKCRRDILDSSSFA